MTPWLYSCGCFDFYSTDVQGFLQHQYLWRFKVDSSVTLFCIFVVVTARLLDDFLICLQVSYVLLFVHRKDTAAILSVEGRAFPVEINYTLR